MRTFKVSNTVRIDAVMGDTRPYVVVHQGVSPGKPPRYIVLNLNEIKSLITQILEAAIYLVSEEVNK